MITSSLNHDPDRIPLGTVVTMHLKEYAGEKAKNTFEGQRGIVMGYAKRGVWVWHPHLDWQRDSTMWMQTDLTVVPFKEITGYESIH